MNLEIKKKENNVRAKVCTFFFDINSIKHNKGGKRYEKDKNRWKRIQCIEESI